MGRKIAIVGTAPTSYGLAPFQDESWEIWGTSRLYQQIPRWDVWFELHELDTIGKGWMTDEQSRVNGRASHLEYLSQQGHPIYLQREEPERIPSGIAYPLEEVRQHLADRFGSTEDYFTNHIAYMIALALFVGAEEIGLYGVDMAMDDEYAYQRPSCEYLIGLARGAGIKVHIPRESDLLKAMLLYGYDDDNPMSAKLRARKLEILERRRLATEARRQARLEQGMLFGRIELAAELFEDIGSGELVKSAEEAGTDPLEFLQTVMEANAGQWKAKAEEAANEIDQQSVACQQLKGTLDDINYFQRSWM